MQPHIIFKKPQPHSIFKNLASQNLQEAMASQHLQETVASQHLQEAARNRSLAIFSRPQPNTFFKKLQKLQPHSIFKTKKSYSQDHKKIDLLDKLQCLLRLLKTNMMLRMCSLVVKLLFLEKYAPFRGSFYLNFQRHFLSKATVENPKHLFCHLLSSVTISKLIFDCIFTYLL